MRTRSTRRPVLVAAVLAALLAALTATRARADLDVPIGNGDRIVGRLEPHDEVEAFRITCPRGARLTITAKGTPVKGTGAPPTVTFGVFDPSEVDVAEGHLTEARFGATLSNFAVPASQAYRIVVRGNGRTGNYELRATWRSRVTFPAAGDLTDLIEDVAFDAEPGSLVSISLKPAQGATAVPTLQDIRTPQDEIVRTFPPRTVRSARRVKVARGGALLLRVVAPSGAGGFTGTITVTAPKPTNRVLKVGAKQIPASQATAVYGSFVGRGGGTVALQGGPTSVKFPVGAFRRETLVLVGWSHDLAPLNDSSRIAGPSVFLGPEGLAFPAAKRPTVTLAFDPPAFPDGLGELQVFTRDARGRVTRVTGVTIDVDDGTVSFRPRHFSAFQVFRVPPSDIRLLPGKMDGLGHLGQSVSGDADTVVVGAPYASDGKGFGAAFVFVRNGSVWKEQARLEPSGPAPASAFGYSVSLSGDTIAVGALGGAPTPGAAYVFARKAGKWTQQAKVLPDVSSNGDFFGRSVSVDGDTLAVGADKSDEESTDEGIAYVYVRDGTSWPQQQQIVATAGSNGDAFGTSVSVTGNTLAVGSPNRGTSDAGAVYVFERAGTAWTQLQRILASDASDFARFGSSVALSRNGTPRLAVGAKSSSLGAGGAGQAYVYSRGPVAWDSEVKFSLADPVAGDQFGNSITVDGDTLVVGGAGRRAPVAEAPDSGTVAVFRLVLDVWTLDTEFIASQTKDSDDFGSSVSLFGGTLFVGSSGARATARTYAGAAYVFDVTQGP